MGKWWSHAGKLDAWSPPSGAEASPNLVVLVSNLMSTCMAIKEDKLVTRLDLRRIIESKPSDYYVCEQPGEGSIPAHLAVVKDDAGDTRVALVTPLGAYSFPALELFGAFLPCGTLLECDLVYNLEWKRHVISVADILAYPTPLGSGAAAGAGGVPDSF